MANQTFTPKLLAHWIFTPDEWQAFLHYEQAPVEQRKSPFRYIKKRKNEYGSNLILLAFILIFFIALPLYAVIKYEIPITISVIVILVLSFILLKISYLLFPEPEPKSIKTIGDVKITTHGVNLNGRVFDWGYAKEGWRLSAIERGKILLKNNITMDLLTFKCRNNYQPNEEKAITIPAPITNENEVNALVNAFNQTGNLFSDESTEIVWKNLNHELDTKVRPFAHDFDSVTFTCKKCGSSFQAARHFNLECKSS